MFHGTTHFGRISYVNTGPTHKVLLFAPVQDMTRDTSKKLLAWLMQPTPTSCRRHYSTWSNKEKNKHIQRPLYVCVCLCRCVSSTCDYESTPMCFKCVATDVALMRLLCCGTVVVLVWLLCWRGCTSDSLVLSPPSPLMPLPLCPCPYVLA